MKAFLSSLTFHACLCGVVIGGAIGLHLAGFSPALVGPVTGLAAALAMCFIGRILT